MRGAWPGLRRRKACRRPGNRVPFVITAPCRGRFYIGPACGGAGFCGRGMPLPYEPQQPRRRTGKLRRRERPGRDKSRPYESILCFGPTGTAAATRAAVGRDAPSRRPRGGADVPILKFPRCGGRERPPYGAGENAAANREIAAARTPAGGYRIRPYGLWQGPRPTGPPPPPHPLIPNS